MKNKWNKSHYKNKTQLFLFNVIIMLVLIALFFVAYFNKNSKIYMLCFSVMSIVCMIYFIVRTRHIKRNIEKCSAKLSEYSTSMLRWHKIILSSYIYATVLFIMVLMYRMVNGDFSVEVWVWNGMQVIMMYSDSVFLSGLFAMGESCYCSGEYIVEYNEIKEVKEVLSRMTSKGEIVLVELYNELGKIGYDKLFLDEYHKIRLKIYQNNEETLIKEEN